MEDARKLGGEKLEECCKEYGQLAEASEEGLDSKGAVVLMMMIHYNINLKISQLTHIYYQSCAIKSSADVWTCGLKGGKQQINAKF